MKNKIRYVLNTNKSALMFVALLIALVTLVVSLSSLANSLDSEVFESIKNSESELWCDISGKGLIQISPDKIKSLEDGVWKFTNGEAKSCEVRTRK